VELNANPSGKSPFMRQSSQQRTNEPTIAVICFQEPRN
jgi:hypothetical protein